MRAVAMGVLLAAWGALPGCLRIPDHIRAELEPQAAGFNHFLPPSPPSGPAGTAGSVPAPVPVQLPPSAPLLSSDPSPALLPIPAPTPSSTAGVIR